MQISSRIPYRRNHVFGCRVTGLLLVTPYLVPAEGAPQDNAVAQAVADALGLKFINRLLFPLRQNQVGNVSPQHVYHHSLQEL
jgi:hypothetical protein